MMYRIWRGIGAFGSGTDGGAAAGSITSVFIRASVARTARQRNRKESENSTALQRREKTAAQDHTFNRAIAIVGQALRLPFA
jgi:hypothetical protein